MRFRAGMTILLFIAAANLAFAIAYIGTKAIANLAHQMETLDATH